jgi:phage/plasmid-like protein (TIGR03299 family)
MHLFETGFFAELPAWHGLGEVTDTALTSTEALKVSGLDWRVLQLPIFVDEREVPNYKANVRDSDDSVLGIVSDRYQPIQNHEGFQVADTLAGQGEILYEAAGSLRNGRTVWMLARTPETTRILEDEVHQYFLFTNAHDGTKAAEALSTPIRVVCANTLAFALGQAKRKVKIRHTGNVRSKFEDAARLLNRSNRFIEAMREEAETLSRISVSEDCWHGLVETLIPFPPEATKRARNSRTEQRADLSSRLYDEDLENFRWTGWGALQAVSNYVTHRQPGRKTDTWAESRLEEVLGKGSAMLETAHRRIRLLV